ncbi:MAG: DUF4407 domain-containing protein [Bacteroidota bacterium]
MEGINTWVSKTLIKITGLVPDIVSSCTPSFQYRVVFLGFLMLVFPIMSAVLASYCSFTILDSVAISTGLFAVFWVIIYSAERAIVTSVGRVSAAGLLFRLGLLSATTLLLLYAGHQIVFEKEIERFALEQFEVSKQDSLQIVDEQRSAFLNEVDRLIIDSLKLENERQIELDSLFMEEDGRLSSHAEGRGEDYDRRAARYDRRFVDYYLTGFQNARWEIDSIKHKHIAPLEDRIADISAKSFDPNTLGFVDRHNIIVQLADQEEGPSIWYITLLLVLFAGIIDLIVLYQRHRMGFDEYERKLEQARVMNQLDADMEAQKHRLDSKMRAALEALQREMKLQVERTSLTTQVEAQAARRYIEAIIDIYNAKASAIDRLHKSYQIQQEKLEEWERPYLQNAHTEALARIDSIDKLDASAIPSS